MLVTTDKYAGHIARIAEAAVKRGHRVIIFFMDEGCRLSTDDMVAALCGLEGVSMAICDLNRKRMDIPADGLAKGIACGSQYDNALMNKEADRVLVF
jgi:sulfur relay (sulfurtransferase) complex TusBCD TusD component (DsrE family)